MKKIINLLVVLFVIFIAGCSSGGSSSPSSSGGNGTPTEIGSLPNGSAVYISQNDLPITVGTPAQAEIYLEGGSPNESYNIVFATNQQLQSKLKTNSVESYGINVTTAPTPCIIGTAGSGAPSKCQITVASSANTYPGTYLITPTATPVSGSGTATILSPLTILVSGSIKPSTKAITSFSLNGTAGVITGQNIAVTMPSGTNLTALVATYITTGQSVKVGSVTQVNGVTPNNFTNPVIYTVIAEDGSSQNYTVTVTVAANSAKAITAFSLDGTAGVISGQNIAVTMPYGTNITALIATFTTTGQSVKVGNMVQVSSVTPNNFTNPVHYTVTAEDGSSQNYTVTVTVAQNSAKAITAFSLNGTTGVISGQNIAVTMPYGTDVTALIATFTTTGQSVTVGATPQVSGVTPNNFTSPVVYTVTAADGSTQNYTVTVTVAQNSAKAITAFSLNGTAGVITGQNIAVTMPYGTNVTTLIATYITTGQSVKVGSVTQVNGVTPNNFTNPVIYTVIAEDGTTQNYTVTVTVAANSAKAITAFSLDGTAGVISGQNIAVTMPYGTNVTALIATFTTTGQSVKVGNVVQVSSVTPNNFTNPVVYTVTAEDSSTQNYTVTVTVALNSDKNLVEFSLNGTVGVIDQDNNTIAVAMPYGTSDVTNLIATYLTDGESVTVGGMEQVNGVTPNNFTNQVTYTVHAANGDTRNYVVTVTIQPVISQATAISFAGNYAFLTSNVSSDITKCSVTNESQLTACSNISVGNLLPQGAAGISAFESTGGMTLFITGNDNPPSIIQCLIPTSGTPTCSKINPAVGLQSNRLLLSTTPDPSSSAKITSFAVGGVSGLINNNNIYVTLPYGANLNGLIATFTATGKSVKVNNVVQTSGVTTNNFTNNVPLQYVVTAKNNTTSTYNVYVRWTAFTGVVINPYAPSAINAPLVYSALESKIINISVSMANGLYSGANYGMIESFPAGMNATGLSSITLPTILNNQGGVASYQYAMTNITESVAYACSVNSGASGFVSCRSTAIPQPSSLVVTTSNTLMSSIYVSSYSQNSLVGCYMFSGSFSCDLDPTHIINLPEIFNLPRSLSINSNRTWLFALNDGDNSYAACHITGGAVDPTTCRKTYFSSL